MPRFAPCLHRSCVVSSIPDSAIAGTDNFFGLFTAEPEDALLVVGLLAWIHKSRHDYSHTFRNLRPAAPSTAPPGDLNLTAWHQRWTARIARQPQSKSEEAQLMRAHNLAVNRRNHVVEAAPATIANDLTPLQRLLTALATPYDETDQLPELSNPPPPGTLPCRTFSGT